ncbi:hypothetical protein F5B20DRAFT_588932 [Whalleya microplaca]|nr:hypothetical protein F5B20DRAFT_588932 [Whalleya microplaca]
MANFEGQFHCGVKDCTITIKHVYTGPAIYKSQNLKIQFMRTIRVPDNAGELELPPSLGAFPLFKVRDYANRLPPEMTDKGGVFFPMYQKEAMWIDFTASSPFMIKIYAGGVNVVSGEHKTEDMDTKFRRLRQIFEGKSIQDYVVVPDQPWLDGIAVSPGVVRQFVAMPMGQGYTVEAQLTGEETAGSLQFEITPTFPLMMKKVTGDFYINIKGPDGTFTIHCSPFDCVEDIQVRIRDITDIMVVAQRLTFDYGYGARKTLAECHVEKGDTLRLSKALVGGATVDMPMGIAAGGKIKQMIRADTEDTTNWFKDAKMTIPVQVLNSAVFRYVTGENPPPCLFNASTYVMAGLPFFGMYDEPSGISGDFDAVKSVNVIEQKRGLADGSEASVHPRLTKLDQKGHRITIPDRFVHSAIRDPDALLNPAGPLREFRTVADLKKELKDESKDVDLDTPLHSETGTWCVII